MALHVHATGETETDTGLGHDFVDRLNASLDQADVERRRLARLRRLKQFLPLLLLIGPIVAWRLMLVSGDGVQVSLGVIAWLAFLLDVGVHIDTSLLTYLGMSWLPSVVGILIFVLVAVTLLHRDSPR